MNKRIIAFLVTIALVLSMLPLAALAEEETAVTPDKVGEAIDQAQSSAVDAAVANAASGQVQTAVDEAVAAANEQLAENKLYTAEMFVEEANADNAERAEAAQEAAKDAAAAADKAKEDQKVATEAKKDAQEALEEAKDADTKGEAVNAAEKAEEASEEAKEAAKDAIAQSVVAAQKAEDAKAAYEAAQKAAEEADADAKEQLASGLINMEEAERRTAEAAQRAQEKYEEMVAAEKAAEEAATAAKADADAAKEVLDQAKANLEQAIVDNAVNVAEKTATAVVTGAALEASKVAVELAGKVVESYEGDLAELEEQVGELNTAIDDAQKAIDEAQAKLDALDETDAEYPQAKAALETAMNELASAEDALKNAEAYKKAKEEAEAAGRAQTMKDLQAAVADDSASAEQKQKLTQMVLGDALSEDQLGEIVWVEGRDDIFYVKDAEGNMTYYECKTVEGVLQFYKADAKEVPSDVSVLPDAKQTFTDANPGKYDITVNTQFQAVKLDGDGKETQENIDIKVIKKVVGWNKYEYYFAVKGYELKQDENGYYYKTVQGEVVRVSLKDPTNLKTSYETAGDPLATNSNTITDKWAAAEDAEANLAEKEQALKEAQDKFDTAEKTYNETKDTLNGIKNTNGEIKVAKQQEVDALNQQVAELDKKLNGDLADQLLRGLIQIAIDEEPDVSYSDVAKRILELEAKKAGAIFGGEPLTPEEEKELAELKSVDTGSVAESGKEMLDIITGIQDGVDLEDVKNTIDLLANSGVSAKTREAILKAVEKVLDDAYTKAAEDLNKAIEDAKKELAEKGQAADAAAKDYAEKELIFLEAAAKEKLAEAAVNNAASLKDKALQAHADAEAALKAYEELAKNYETDKSLVAAAKKAYEDAAAKADEALKAANAAIRNAFVAAKAALEAREIADNFPEQKVKTTYNNTGLTIAKYAYSLLGPLMPGFSENNDAMTSAEFVRLVYAHFGIKLDLTSVRPEDVAKNGVRIDNKLAKPGDLVCIHANDGTVGTFGICYGEGSYVFFNETSREVELGTCAQITGTWFVVRVIK